MHKKNCLHVAVSCQLCPRAAVCQVDVNVQLAILLVHLWRWRMLLRWNLHSSMCIACDFYVVLVPSSAC